MDAEKPRSFNEFWPSYVRDHSHPTNRRLHVVGTGLAFVLLALGAILEQPLFLLGALVSGYALSWIGHFFVEHNRPATFRAPLWSLMADFRMFYLTINGKMAAEIERVSLARKP